MNFIIFIGIFVLITLAAFAVAALVTAIREGDLDVPIDDWIPGMLVVIVALIFVLTGILARIAEESIIVNPVETVSEMKEGDSK